MHKNLCADVIGNDFDLTKYKFSYTSLKELESKVPKFLELCASPVDTNCTPPPPRFGVAGELSNFIRLESPAGKLLGPFDANS